MSSAFHMIENTGDGFLFSSWKLKQKCPGSSVSDAFHPLTKYSVPFVFQ